MKFYSQNQTSSYYVNEEAFVSPVRLLSPAMRQWYLWKFFHEPGFMPNKVRCNTLLHGYSTPRG